MKIESITATWLHADIPAAQQHTSDYGRVDAFDTVLVEVHAGGLIGYGEAKASVGSVANCGATCALIEEDLAPMIIGADARQISRLWDVMYNGSRAHYAIARGRSFPTVGSRGHGMGAISGIDMALWDLLGKSLDAPVSQLLGGRRQEALPAYASGGWAPVDRIAEELQGFLDQGQFRAVKMRVGAADGTVANSIARVNAARGGLGDETAIMCDAHGTFNVAEAKRFCRGVVDANIDWLEEPLSGDDFRGLVDVRTATDIPIATGEREATRFPFRELAELRAVDVLQPDPAIAGGITELMRIEAICSAFQIRFAPHLWGGALNFAAGLHATAAASTGFIVEYPVGANPMLRELPVEGVTVTDGMIAVPDGPGLGVTIDPDFVKATRVDLGRNGRRRGVALEPTVGSTSH